MSQNKESELDELNKWLADVCKESGIPSFEKNDRNIDMLLSLKKNYDMVKGDLKISEEDASKRTAVYDEHVNRIQGWLDCLGVGANNFDVEGKSCLDSMASLSYEMSMVGSSSAEFIPPIHKLEEENHDINEALDGQKKRMIGLLQMSEDFSKKLEEVKRITEQSEKLKTAEDNVMLKDQMKSKFNVDKVKQYQANLEKFEKKLQCVGFEPSLAIDSIDKRFKELEMMKKQLETAKETVSYYTLPPDMSLAKVEVETARLELEEMWKGLADSYPGQS